MAKNNGRYAEDKVKTRLEEIDRTNHAFDFDRVSDAKSGHGFGAKKVVGDFQTFSPEIHCVLEVKSLAHNYRIPHKNISQLPKLRKRIVAGGRCLIVVYHTTSKLWRVIPAEELEIIDKGSWDVSNYTLYADLSVALPTGLLTERDYVREV